MRLPRIEELAPLQQITAADFLASRPFRIFRGVFFMQPLLLDKQDSLLGCVSARSYGFGRHRIRSLVI